MPISDEHSIIFLHIPKTGGSTIENLLDIREAGDNFFCGTYVTSDITPQHYPYKKLRSLVPPGKWDTYFKFTIVRNPWERLVSTYFNNKRGINTFEAFVRLLAGLFEQHPGLHDGNVDGCKVVQRYSLGHVLPQHLFIGEGVEVFRFENFQDVAKMLLKRIGTEKPIEHCMRSRHEHYSKYYTLELQEIVGHLYKKDIELLGYQFSKSM